MTDKIKIVFTWVLLSLWTCSSAQAEPSAHDPAPRNDGYSLQTDPVNAPIVHTFYRDSGYRSLWTTPTGLSPKGRTLAITLLEAEAEGLEPEDYLSPTFLERCLDDVMDNAGWCELQLTEAFLHYAEDVGYGRHRLTGQDPEWHIKPRPFDARAALAQAQSTTDMAALLERLPPIHPQYRRLREALASYRAEARAGEWPAIPDGPVLEPHVSHEQVPPLRQRLAAEGYLDGPQDADSDFDDDLRDAVVRFQASHGLTQDGKVGPKTRAALNVPLAERIAQIRINMERWRWLPRDMGTRYLLINLPAFELDIVVDEQVVHRMRAITGRVDRTSPSFASYLTQIVLNPSWTVPRRLAVEDLLPRQQQDPEFLAHKQIAVLQRQDGQYVEIDPQTVDWQQYDKDNFPFVLRQAPGPKNSLGQIKFIMPNPFAIFLHDTPGKALFNKTVRTLSSGCIRLQEPLELADWLLEAEQPDMLETLRGEIDSGESLTLPLRERVPVYLVYLTAWVDEAKNLQFRDDIYGRNHILLSLFRP